MCNQYGGYYKDIENCRNEIRTARELMGNKNTTRQQFEAMEKGLGILYLNCPEDFQEMALAHIQEAQRRKFYIELSGAWD